MSEIRIDNTPYDDAFKTMLDSCPQMIIPVVNEIFGENFTGKELIVKSPNEYFVLEGDGKEKRIATDSVYTIYGTVTKRYHIECQSTVDGTMLMRIFEYDAQIALDGAEVEKHKLIVKFPHSAIIYLRDRSTTPDDSIIRIETPGGSIEYTVPILKVKKYTADDLFAKNLLFLLPFHIFKYEERFDIIIKDNAAYEDLFKHFADIRSRLDYMGESGKLAEFDKQAVIDMSKKVIRALGAKHGKISEVSNAMGGVVLDFEAKRIFNEGREEGRESKSVEVIDKLIAKDGLSVEEACDKLDYSVDDYYAYKAKNHDTIIRDNTR